MFGTCPPSRVSGKRQHSLSRARFQKVGQLAARTSTLKKTSARKHKGHAKHASRAELIRRRQNASAEEKHAMSEKRRKRRREMMERKKSHKSKSKHHHSSTHKKGSHKHHHSHRTKSRHEKKADE